MCKREVWKLGGSVLKNSKAFLYYAKAARSYLDRNPSVDRLYIVASAAKGDTERLIDTVGGSRSDRKLLRKRLQGERPAEGECCRFDTRETPVRLLQGEIESAHKLRLAFVSAGEQAKVVTQLDFFPIVSQGSYLFAELDIESSRHRFELFDRICRQRRVVIITGFGAVNISGEATLLGRNASDYVAAIFSSLDRKVNRVMFAKDVDGIYDKFRTRDQYLIPSIKAENLRDKQLGEVLDRRVLDIIASDFCFTNDRLRVGTSVFLSDPQPALNAALEGGR